MDVDDAQVAVSTVLAYPGIHYLRANGREVLASTNERGF